MRGKLSWPAGPHFITWGLGPWGLPDLLAAGLLPPSASDMIETYIRFKQPATSQNLNRTRERILPKGIYYGGKVARVAGQLKVTVSPYFTVGFDGMVTRDLSTTTIDVRANEVQRIVLLAKFSPVAPPTTAIFALNATTFASHPLRDFMITFALLDVPNGAVEVLDSHIDLTVRDTIDSIGRSPWRAVVADQASLPVPPAEDVRRGDRAVTVDNLQEYVFDGVAWQPASDGAVQNLVDGRIAHVGSAAAPLLELGRLGITTSDRGAAGRVARVMPVFHQLTPVQTGDADIGGTIAARTVRKTAANIVYAKNRNSANPNAVEEADLRIGAVAGLGGGAFISVVQVGDSDIGTALVAATLVEGSHDGEKTYVYAKVGANNAAVETGDLRLWQVTPQAERLGLAGGGAPVSAGDSDVGDAAAAEYVYSREAPATEHWYSFDAPAAAAVASGTTFLRLSEVTNTGYHKDKKTVIERTDRGGVFYRKPETSSTGIEIDSAGAPGSLPGFRFWEAGVAGEWITDSVLGGLGEPLRGAGIQLTGGLFNPTQPGGLGFNVAAGVAWVEGERFSVAAVNFVLVDNTSNFIYVDANGVMQQTTTPAIGLTTSVCSLYRVDTAAGAITRVYDLRRDIARLDSKLVIRAGSQGQFLSIQDAVDYLKAHRDAFVNGSTHPLVVEIDNVETLSASINLAGLRGVTFRHARAGALPGQGGGTAGDSDKGVGIRWDFDGPAFDLADAEDITFDGLHFHHTATVDTPLSACFGSTGTVGKNIHIRNCSTHKLAGNANRNRLSFFIAATGQTVHGWVIENNDVDVTRGGIRFQNIYRSHIAHNIIRHSGAIGAVNEGIYASATAEDCVIAENHLHPSNAGGQNGDGTGFPSGISFATANRCLIEGNQIRYTGAANGAYGIRVQGGTGTTIEENTCRLTTQTASWHGISVFGSSWCKVVGNTIESTALTGTGIDFESNSDGHVVGNSVVFTPGGGAQPIGIDIASTVRTVVAYNILKDVGDSVTGGIGIAGGNTTQACTIVGNILQLCVNGIRLVTTPNPARCLVVGNYIVAHDIGVELVSITDVEVIGNHIETTVGEGVDCQNSENFVVSGNRIIAADAGAAAISVGATGNRGNIVGNNCTDSAAANQIQIAGAGTVGMLIGNLASVSDAPGWTPSAFANGATGLNKP